MTARSPLQPLVGRRCRSRQKRNVLFVVQVFVHEQLAVVEPKEDVPLFNPLVEWESRRIFAARDNDHDGASGAGKINTIADVDFGSVDISRFAHRGVGVDHGRLDVGVAKEIPGNSLRQDRRQVCLVEDTNQIHHLALERNGQPEDGQKIRELRSRLHGAHMRLREAYQFRERLLTEAALQSHFAKARSEELTGCRCVS